MPYTPSGTASALVSPRQSHRLAKLWWLTRVDGFTLRLTDHDHKLAFDDLQTYTPVGGLDATALRKASALEPQNFEVTGVLNSSAITYDDLHARRWIEAEIHEYVVDWMFPWAGALQHSRYWIADTRQDGEKWTAQVEGISYWLKFNTGQVHSRGCWKELGGPDCTVALGPLQFTGGVDTVADDHIEFRVNALSSTSDGYWADGQLDWIAGPNIGLMSKIRTYTDATHTVRLFLRTPFPISTGDQFVMSPGCDHTRGANGCTKFANNDNFGGDSFLPGTDKLIAPPSS